ncbi:hypothetical protein NKH77_49025 [Streptomyces sp. M19]
MGPPTTTSPTPSSSTPSSIGHLFFGAAAVISGTAGRLDTVQHDLLAPVRDFTPPFGTRRRCHGRGPPRARASDHPALALALSTSQPLNEEMEHDSPTRCHAWIRGADGVRAGARDPRLARRGSRVRRGSGVRGGERAAATEDALGWAPFTEQTRPWTRWWWLGSAVTEAGLARHLREFARVGFGGVEIQPIYEAQGSEDQVLTYLSPGGSPRWTPPPRTLGTSAWAST